MNEKMATNGSAADQLRKRMNPQSDTPKVHGFAKLITWGVYAVAILAVIFAISVLIKGILWAVS